jgi:hypothetical protein
MSTRRIFVVLFPVVFVAVSILVAWSLPGLFAREQIFGDLCWQGEYLHPDPFMITNPPRPFDPPNPAKYTEIMDDISEFTDGWCEANATCIPPDCGCDTWDSAPDTRVSRIRTEQDFTRQENGTYKAGPVVVTDRERYGTFIHCADDMDNSW